MLGSSSSERPFLDEYKLFVWYGAIDLFVFVLYGFVLHESLLFAPHNLKMYFGVELS